MCWTVGNSTWIQLPQSPPWQRATLLYLASLQNVSMMLWVACCIPRDGVFVRANGFPLTGKDPKQIQTFLPTIKRGLDIKAATHPRAGLLKELRGRLKDSSGSSAPCAEPAAPVLREPGHSAAAAPSVVPASVAGASTSPAAWDAACNEHMQVRHQEQESALGGNAAARAAAAVMMMRSSSSSRISGSRRL